MKNLLKGELSEVERSEADGKVAVLEAAVTLEENQLENSTMPYPRIIDNVKVLSEHGYGLTETIEIYVARRAAQQASFEEKVAEWSMICTPFREPADTDTFSHSETSWRYVRAIDTIASRDHPDFAKIATAYPQNVFTDTIFRGLTETGRRNTVLAFVTLLGSTDVPEKGPRVEASGPKGCPGC